MTAAAIVAAAFLAGSIPFGYLLGRLAYGFDIRERGSGNIGAMNALRTLGKGGAAAVLLLDAAKGFLPTLLAARWIDAPALTAFVAAAAVVGHCFSPWLRFKGGKGVATSFGALFGLCWPAGIVAVAGWIAGAALTGFSSIGSMLGGILAPFAIWLFTGSLAEALFGAFAALLIVFTHRENLGRLRAGTESPISQGLSRRGPYTPKQ